MYALLYHIINPHWYPMKDQILTTTPLKMGHPSLRKHCQEVKDFKGVRNIGVFFKELIENNPWSGIAAPQLGINLQIVAFQYAPDVAERKGGTPLPPRVLINPVITPLSDETYDDWEACLSLPDLMGLVPRYTHIRFESVDETGAPVSEEASGHLARIIQHECDHLQGILYPERMKDLTALIYRDQFQVWQEEYGLL